MPLDDAPCLEFGQALGENTGSYACVGFEELSERALADRDHVTQDQQAPAVAEGLDSN